MALVLWGLSMVKSIKMNKPKLLAVIPARGGSKRILHKNIKDFLGRPLIAYSIESAQKAGIFEDIIVSTDDHEIAKVAQELGAQVPFMRDAVLSNDFTGTGAVACDAYHKMKALGHEYDGTCTIYATAPLLTPEHLVKAYEMFVKDHVDYLFSGCELPFPFQRSFFLDEANKPTPVMPECIPMRSQDLPKAYQDAGQFYFKSIAYTEFDGLSPDDRKQVDDSKFVTRLYEMPRHRVIDIDTPEDWEYALVLAKAVNELKLD